MRIIILLLNLYAWLIIARALVSWVSQDQSNPIIRFLHVTTEPVLRPLRTILSPSGIGGIDISPILAIVLIQIAKYFLIRLAWF
jgi:YggT family protein